MTDGPLLRVTSLGAIPYFPCLPSKTFLVLVRPPLISYLIYIYSHNNNLLYIFDDFCFTEMKAALRKKSVASPINSRRSNSLVGESVSPVMEVSRPDFMGFGRLGLVSKRSRSRLGLEVQRS